METIIIRSRDEFDDLTLKNIKIRDDITFISGLEKDTKKRLLQCVGFGNGWNEMQAKLWFAGLKQYADEIANLPDEAAGKWLEYYDEQIMAGDDSDTAAKKAWDKIKKHWIQDNSGEWQKYSEDWQSELTKRTNPILEVFRAGDYPQGTITIEDIDDMVTNYDPTIFRGPITVDHSQVGPAQGWVQKIFRMGESLFAIFEDLSTKFIEKVRNKEYVNRSIEIFELEYKGKYYWPYLKAVTFLGAGAPQVKGMEEPIFVSKSAMAFSIDRSNLIGFPVDVTEDSIRIRQKNPDLFEKDSFKTITLIGEKAISGLKVVIGKLKGKDTTTVQTFIFDKSSWTLEKAKAWVKEHGGKYNQLDPNQFNDMGGKLEKIELTQEQLDAKLKIERETTEAKVKAAEEKRFSDVKTENKALKEELDESEKTANKKFAETEYNRLYTAKKLLPADKDLFLNMIDVLSPDKAEIKFSETVKGTPAQALVKFIESLPDRIDTKKKTDDDDPNNKSLDTDEFSGTQFADATDLTKKRAIFIEKILKEKKVKVGDPTYQAEYRDALKQAVKEVTE